MKIQSTYPIDSLRKLMFAAAILLFAMIWPATAIAQTYPAQVSLNIQPPYSPYLSDFLSPGQERMQLMVTFLDLNEPSWDAKIRMKIDGNGLHLETMPIYFQPLTLVQGPNFIDGSTLQLLTDFSKMNVSGMSKSDLVNAGRLPEGMYDFCIEVIDAGREIPLGQPGCFSAMLIQNNPPQLILPTCGETISSNGGPGLSINWIPMHDPSIMVQYQIKLVAVPLGMNVNDAINGTNTPILNWEPVNGTNFVYGPQFLPLENNTKYAFQVRVIDLSGLTTFENDGLGQVCWFDYGFTTGGHIDLTSLANGVTNDFPDKVDLAWEGPDNAISGQQLKYHIKVVKLNANDNISNPSTATAVMARTMGVYYDDSTTVLNNIFGHNILIQDSLEANAEYAWQVSASTEGTVVAKSDVWKFKAPPRIYGFYGADGSIYVDVTNLDAFNEVSPTKSIGVTGTGKAVLKEGQPPTEVSFSDLTIEMSGNRWNLKVGEIPIPSTEKIPLDFGDYGDGDFDLSQMVITSLKFEADGQLTWRYPLSVNAPANSVVLSKPGRLNFYNFVLSGGIVLEDDQSYDLLIPLGFSVAYKSPSRFVVNNGEVKLKLTGDVLFSDNLATVSGDRLVVPFSEIENPWYFSTPRLYLDDKFLLAENSNMTLEVKQVDFDFTGAESPGVFSGDPEWVGAYFGEYIYVVPTDFDEKEFISLAAAKEFGFKVGDPGFQPSWVAQAGLTLNVNQDFDEAAHSAVCNTFPAKFTNIFLKIEDNMISDSKLSGFIKIPFFGPEKKLNWISPITGNGFQPAYLTEPSIAAMNRTFNPSSAEGKVVVATNQAIFEGGDHIKANVNMASPYMEVALENLGGFKVWGDGGIGFGEKNGTKDLPTQVTGKIGDFAAKVSAVGARKSGDQYLLAFKTKLILPGGAVAQEGMTEVFVAGQQGEAPTAPSRTLSDGSSTNSSFAFAPISISIDNSLMLLNMSLDYYQNDPTFGSRLEGKGNVLVKQPDKIIAGARFVIGSKDGTDFWYARAYAQGLNKILKKYPQYYLNGFDFRIYHHLGRVQGAALAQPNQFSNFWDLSPQNESASSINGNTINPNIALGMYGKIGLHDSYSGSRQQSGPVNITEDLSSLALPIPDIPNFCDLKMSDGTRICDLNLFDFDLSLINPCELRIPSGEKLCDIFDFSGLTLCDIKLPGGPSLCDLDLGNLPNLPGIPPLPSPCDLKTPGGKSICDLGYSICDMKLNGTSICQLDPNFNFPNLNLCQLKFPDGTPVCDFFNLTGINPCDLKFADGSSFCDLDFSNLPNLPNIPSICELLKSGGNPIAIGSICKLDINFCDIKTTNGTSICNLKLWKLPQIPPCEWIVPGGKTLCNLNLSLCDMDMPGGNLDLCNLSLGDLGINFPNFCAMQLPNGKSPCEILLPPFQIPNIPMPNVPVPNIPVPFAMPENQRMQHFYLGLGIEVNNGGGVENIVLNGSGWYFCDRFDPNSSYLARGFGGVEFWPGLKKVQFNMQGETGAIVTEQGTIKPLCGAGTIKGEFTEDYWWVDAGSANDPISVNIACRPELNTSGYLKARPNGILASGWYSRSMTASKTVNLAELAKLNFSTSASFGVQMKIYVRFDQPALTGEVSANANASVSMDIDPLVGDNSHINFASVSCSGKLSFKIDSGICMSGRLKGKVTVLGESVTVATGMKMTNGSVSISSNPSSCN